MTEVPRGPGTGATAGPPPAVRESGAVGTAKTFAEIVKFEHSVFALPYALVGALYGASCMALGVVSAEASLPTPWVTAGGWPTLAATLWIAVAMVGARSFAFVVNRAVDREIDARNPRTAGRAVPAGLVKAWELWLFAAVVLAVYLAAVSQLAPITHRLWPIPLAMFLIYPYTKRFTWLCHLWLGACLGLAPVGAWAAVTNSVSTLAPWLFGLAVTLWTAGFDMIYATQDVECDRRDGVHSVPADLGVGRALRMTFTFHVFTVALLAAAGLFACAGWPYYFGVGVAAMLLAYENAIVSPADLSRVNAAFFTTNGVIAIVVLAGALADRLLQT